MAEKTIEQLQEELDMAKLHSKSLEELNEKYKEIMDRQAKSYDSEVERLKKEASGLNNTVTDVCRKNDKLEREKADLQKNVNTLKGELQDEIKNSEMYKESRDRWTEIYDKERKRTRGIFNVDIRTYEELVTALLKDGFEIRMIPDGNQLEISILEREAE